MNRLSLCVIAKNEAHNITACLRSVAGLVDECVVLDTGSSDDTIALAHAAGAVVVERPWDDDFSAARNASIAAATGDWVLILDADERLAAGGDAVRAVIERDDVDCGLIPLHNAIRVDATMGEVLEGFARAGEPVLLPRLVRRTPDLAYRGVVHESLGDWLRGRETRVCAVPASIVHYGAVADVRRELAKDDRNLRLLERRVVEEPEHVGALTYLAIEYVRVDRIGDAVAIAERAWEALQRALASGGQRPSYVSLATLRMQLQIAQGLLDDALDTAAKVRSWGSVHPNIDFFEARANELAAARAADDVQSRRLLLRAGARYCACLDMQGRIFSEEVHDGITGWLGQVRLGTVLLQVEEHTAALEAFDAALTVKPALPEALLGRVEALIWLGSAQEALATLEPLLAAPSPDAWLLAHLAASALGLLEDAAVFWEVAWERRGEAFSSDHRARWMADSEESSDAAEVAPPPARTPASGQQDNFVFIGGAGRSGTTLFRAMLHAHPSFYCGPELKLVTVLAELRQQWSRGVQRELAGAGVTDDVLDAACAAFVRTLLRETAAGAARVAEKTPHNVLHMPWLAKLFPAARFIHVVRDPRAVASSLVKQGWVDTATGDPIWYCKDLPSAARYWAEVVTRGLRQATTLPGRVLLVRYEDLVRSPESELRRVLDFLGEPWDPAVLQHERGGAVLPASESSSQAVARPLHRDALERWRDELSADDLAEIEAITGDLLVELAYPVGATV